MSQKHEIIAIIERLPDGCTLEDILHELKGEGRSQRPRSRATSPQLKYEIIAMIKGLPDDCTLDDVRYHLYVRQKIDDGITAIERGDVTSHEEARKRFAHLLP